MPPTDMQEVDQILEKTEQQQFILAVRKDGIVHIYYKDNTIVDVALQNALLQLIASKFGKEKMLYIFEAGMHCSVTKEARSNAIAIEDLKPAIASVVYVQNQVYRMVANFYIKFNRPKQPFHVVSDFKAGIEWLLKQKSDLNQQVYT